MSVELTINGTNSIANGTVVYEKGESISSIALVLKGRVTVQADGVKTVLGSGNFLGICDIMNAQHSFTYIALDDLVLYGLPISSVEQAGLLLEEKQQYRGLLVTSVNFFMADIYKNYLKLQKVADDVTVFVLDLYERYKNLVESSGLVPEKISQIDSMAEKKPSKCELAPELEYYLQCSKVQVEAQKNFFGSSAYIAKKHYMEQCKVFPSLLDGCRYYAEWISRFFRIMIMNEKNLFSLLGKMTLSVKKSGQNDNELSRMLDKLLEQINEIETILIENASIQPNLDRKRMEEVYFALLSDDTGNLEAYEKEDMQILNGSLKQILEYAPIHVKDAEEFEEAVQEFMGLPDKFARTPEAAAVRKKVAGHFFTLYEAVVKKSFEDANIPMAVKLFLRYGFISEELLTGDELRMLMTLPEPDNTNLECKVYTMAMWLKEIYEGRKNPSKDEFDTDYEAHVRKRVQEGKIEKTEFEDVFMNPDERLHFEVMNLFRYADRLVNGNISTFVPVLCSEGLFTRIENAVVTGAALNQAVHKIEKIDYSMFHRERLVSYEEAEITQFSVVSRYMPDFILFPVYGKGGLMWQDIEGRQKNSHARILMPSLIEQNLEQDVMKMMAYFRWEKCRTDMGAQWNNYRYPSLTSEYTDYLQFYKKNADLSPEKKEKVKAQLQQCNNRHRDVFARDYQDWIMREAVGAMKLNRVAREILFTYCPLSSDVAQTLMTQNSYQEAGRRYMLEKRKREKNLVTIEKKFEKAGMDVPEEVTITKNYLLEL